MKRWNAPAGTLRVAATAATGVVAGHLLGYKTVFPGLPQRHSVLIQTGHGYLPAGGRLAVMLAVVAAAAWCASGYRRARSVDGAAPTFRAIAVRLAVLQVCAFVGLEFFERVAGGVPYHHFLLPVLAVGIVAQILVAMIGAALVVLLDRTGAVAANRSASTPDEADAVWTPRRFALVGRPASSPPTIRGPPATLLPSP